MHGRMTKALVLLLVALVLSACGPQAEAPIGSGRSADPAELLGVWRVEAPGVPDGTTLHMSSRGFELERGGEITNGSWDASHDTLVADVWGYSGTNPPESSWLVGVRPYLVAENGWHVLSDDGARGATMSRATSEEEPPSSDAAADLPEPEPLPDGLVPVTAERLVGRWEPLERVVTDPHVVLEEDGTWTGSDGCNGAGGRWAVGDGGRLLSTNGPTTLVWCEGAPVGSWVGDASRGGLDGNVLVLLDAAGSELGRLTRA